MIDQAMLYRIQTLVREVTGYAAHVAGGALRDLRLGRPIKDIDVLIVRDRSEDVYSEHEQRYYARKVAKALGSELVTTSESGYPDGEQVYATYEVAFEGETVNLIFVSDLIDALNEFPDTISQVYLDDEGVPVYSEDFEEAVVRGVIVARLEEGNKRRERLSLKFPDFKWQYAESLGEWA